jgi:hypothetical protein
MNWLRGFIGLLLLLCVTFMAAAQTSNSIPILQRAMAVDSLAVAPVSAAYPVGFALLTHPPDQYVAFYDDNHRLTVAQRKLDQRQWTFYPLPDVTGWDSHNYITLAADDDGFLHLSADMHVARLKYFRTAKPWDASTFQRIDKMTGENEVHCTYPKFLRGANNEFLFTYRDGGSGDGNQVYDIYNLKMQTWRPFLDNPLTDGHGTNSAYFDGPVRGPDGWFHLVWVWRATPDGATCHDLSYARSRDLKHWETGAGQPLSLPIRVGSSEVVDPVPEHDGMSNGNIKIGFDAMGRVTISYHKNDTNGYTQPFIARLENGRWVLHQVTDWPATWHFGGIGTLVSAIRLGRVQARPDGRLTEDFDHFKFGKGTWLLNPETLRATGEVARQVTPPELDEVEGNFPGLEVHWSDDLGHSGAAGEEYKLRWETLDVNRDHPREGELPAPTMLKVVEVKIEPGPGT